MAGSLGPELDRQALGKKRCSTCDYELRLISGHSVCPHCGEITKEAPADYRKAAEMIQQAFDIPPEPKEPPNGDVQVPCGKWVPTRMQADFHIKRCRQCKASGQLTLGV